MIAFDLGGVLVGLDPTWPARLGIHPPDAHAWMANAPSWAAWERGEVGEHAVFAEFARVFGVERDAIGAAVDAWVTGPLPGAVELLGELQGPRALLSNTNPRHWSIFDPDRRLRARAGIAIPSHLLGARKPEPEAWHRAAAILGGRPSLFVDDTLVNVDAARAAGWTAEQVSGVDDVREALARRGLLTG